MTYGKNIEKAIVVDQNTEEGAAFDIINNDNCVLVERWRKSIDSPLGLAWYSVMRETQLHTTSKHTCLLYTSPSPRDS